MFKLPAFPSPQADIHELADFVELLCWMQGRASEREIVRYMGRMSDNIDNDGCEDEEDINFEIIDDVMNEIGRRGNSCGRGYPFILKRGGTVLAIEDNYEMQLVSIIYIFLLCCTRLNMQTHKIQTGIDGTCLFEMLSMNVLKNYLGISRSKGIMFGTSDKKTFKKKIEDMCSSLTEGGYYRKIDTSKNFEKDGGLDAVVWVPFSDEMSGKLVIFAQCKTGTRWREYLTILNPSEFVEIWTGEPWPVKPIKAFFIAESSDKSKWTADCFSAGILFDRCRVVDFCGELPIDLENEIKKWTFSAKQQIKEMLSP
jgi:hypothetical protein